MKIAETIYTPFQKGLFFYLFWLCPAIFGIFHIKMKKKNHPCQPYLSYSSKYLFFNCGCARTFYFLDKVLAKYFLNNLQFVFLYYISSQVHVPVEGCC